MYWFNNRQIPKVIYLFPAVFFLIISSSLLLKASTFSKTAIRWSLVEMLEACVIVPKICAISISCRTSFLLDVPITKSLRPLSLIKQLFYCSLYALINYLSLVLQKKFFLTILHYKYKLQLNSNITNTDIAMAVTNFHSCPGKVL